jgi:hypothetical protein
MYEQAHKAAAFNITQTTGSTASTHTCAYIWMALFAVGAVRLIRLVEFVRAAHGPVLVFTNCKMSLSLFVSKAQKQLFSLTQTTTTHHRMGRWTDNQARQPRLGLWQPVRAVG